VIAGAIDAAWRVGDGVRPTISVLPERFADGMADSGGILILSVAEA